MKKIILIGATLLIATSAIVVANTNSVSDCENCPMGICKPDQCKEKCGDPEECCKQ